MPQKLRPWIEARRKLRLSHAQVQMARELGMTPKKLGKLDDHKQERWKLPLRLFIEECYWKRFRKERPDNPRPLEILLGNCFLALACNRRCAGEGELVFRLTTHY